jgi:hypothetical protein
VQFEPATCPQAVNGTMKAVRRSWRTYRAVTAVVGCGLLVGATVACGGDEGGDTAARATTSAPTSTSTAVVHTVPPVTRTTIAPPDGVETFSVSASHIPPETSFTYAEVPPVGGPHALSWETCTFYDRPVPNETAVHSLEHGAIWITYRPDVPQVELQVLRDMARQRANLLVSRWDDGLPAPIVLASWGRRLKVESAQDPRVQQFILAFSGMSPEPNGSCI